MAQGAGGALSSLNTTIDTLNLAKEGMDMLSAHIQSKEESHDG